MRIAFAGIHRGEEPCISVENDKYRGSGMIFFTGCPLGCFDCQNRQISSPETERYGRMVTTEELADICLVLQRSGAANINLVTGTHFIPSIAAGLRSAKVQGLSIPIIWNTSSFESVSALRVIDDLIDIYLADMKTLSPAVSSLVCGKAFYGSAATKAIEYMVERHPLVWDADRLLQGVILRHLVLPGHMGNTEAVLSWHKERIGIEGILSLMVQYIPLDPASNITRCVSQDEYHQLLSLLESMDIEDGYIQELGDEAPWIPDFTAGNPFPDLYCDPIWHWKYRFFEG